MSHEISNAVKTVAQTGSPLKHYVRSEHKENGQNWNRIDQIWNRICQNLNRMGQIRNRMGQIRNRIGQN